MRKFRRSNKSNDLKQPSVRISTKDAAAINPPKKVVVAAYPYNPEPERGPDYLTFGVGDFFHVVDREDDPDWYEVLDAKGNRGLVPRPYVEDVGKKDFRGKPGTQQHDSAYSDGAVGGPEAAEEARKRSMSKDGSPKKSGNMVYGVVLFDFDAERADELPAQAGESIIIIAQSNPEWYVAKPIMRLGGPGLIPSSFVEIRNSSTNRPVDDPLEAVRAAGIPKVEEWKSRAAWYKNNSVPLGKLSSGSQQGLQQGMERLSIGTSGTRKSSETNQSGHDLSHQRSGSSYGHRNTIQATHPRLVTPALARVTGFTQDRSNNEFYYQVDVLNEDGRAWSLLRGYKEFYDLQIHLVEQFPEAGGKVAGIQRSLPYLPGPMIETTLELTEKRQPHMHDYAYKVLRIDPAITNSHPIKLFFSPREYDKEIPPFGENDVNRFSTLSRQSIQQQMAPSNGINGNMSHQSSTSLNAMNGGGGGGAYGNSNPYQQQTQDQRHQYRPTSPPNQQQAPHYRSPSELRVPNGLPNGGPPHLLRNNSAMTAASANSNTSQQTNGGGNSIVKIKVFLGENCILLRLSSNYVFSDLVAKLKERWLLEPGIDRTNPDDVHFNIDYKDEPTQTYFPISGDEELDVARERNDKLTLRVNPVQR